MNIWGVGPRFITYAAVLMGTIISGACSWPELYVIEWWPMWPCLWLGAILILIGLIQLTITAFFFLPRFKKGELITTGPFARSRNPLYACWLFWIFPGIAVASRLWPLLILPKIMALALKLMIGREERVLRDKFGPAYVAYRAKVPFIWPIVF